MNPTNVTPMMRQYLSIKDKYPDALLFYRMGDFYEMFFEDAETASPILEIALTSRNKNQETPVPMCGVPVRAIQGYIARLIAAGHKVAICDQVEDPAKAKGLVKREVVRVITPGMILDDAYLDAKSNNFLLALCPYQDQIGIAYTDISTGTFRLAESGDAETALQEALRIMPSETLLPAALKGGNHNRLAARIERLFPEKGITYLNSEAFDPRRGRERLLEQFKTLSLEGFGCEQLAAGIGAAGALLEYVRDTQKQPVAHFTGIETYTLDNYLWIDDISCRNLELLRSLRNGTRVGTLIAVLDRSVTAMGGRLLKGWLRYPLKNKAQIEERLDAVGETLARPAERRDIRGRLKSVYDLERLGSKIAMGQANARDLVALKQSLQMIPGIWSLLAGFESRLLKPQIRVQALRELADLIDAAIREDAPLTLQEGGIIKEGYNAELDELISVSRDGKSWLARLEAEERTRTGINSLKVSYNRVFGYYLEVPKAQIKSVPPDYVRKQTLVNAERYITDALKQYEQKVFNAEEKRGALEYSLFNEVRKEVLSHNPQIQEAARFLAQLDCLFGLAEIAEQNNYQRPEINTEGYIRITDGRHPVVEKMIRAERFVPNSIQLDNDENQILIITGPNMAGKSTVLRQVALTVLMAQMGSFVPAASASLSITDRIFTRVGALDNLSHGQSTFMVEMEETANILNNASADSLVIMDEIGRGTSTYDGLAIAWAVAEFLHDLKGTGVKTLFATHYHELTELAHSKPRLKNFNIAVKEWNDEIIFLRKLVPGGTNRSYGIQVARLAGIPEPVIKHAKQILFKIENATEAERDLGAASNEKQNAKPGQVQMSLFQEPEQRLVETLAQTDIAQMTPLEALNCLNTLAEKARGLLTR